MRGKRNRSVGLSVGPGKMALAEVYTDASGNMEVGRVAVADTPEESVYHGRIVSPTAISRAIRELFSAGGISGTRELALAIADEGSITRLQVLPTMSRPETLEAIMGEVENYAAMSGGEPAVDFQPVEGRSQAGLGQTEVLFVATPRELLDSYLSAMETANMRAPAIETRPLAILRAFTNLSRVPLGPPLRKGDLGDDGSSGKGDSEDDKSAEARPAGPVMLASIEENVGMIIVVRNENVEFVHDVEIGTEGLQSTRNVRELAREIRSSVKYYHTNVSAEEEIERIVLFRDDAGKMDILGGLEGQLEPPIPIIEPPPPVESGENLEGNSLSAFAAIGAAMRMAMGRRDESINLLASSRRVGTGSLRKRVLLSLVIFLSLVLVAMGAKVWIGMKAASVEANLITLQRQQEISEAEANSQIPILQQGVGALRAHVEITDAALNSIKWSNCAKLFEEIRTIIPKSVQLISLRWSGDSIYFDALGLSYDSVFKFRSVLYASPYFEPVTLISVSRTEVSEQSSVRFQIKCGVRMDLLGGGEVKVAKR
jgi:type IV pilus assembly protein PilM